MSGTSARSRASGSTAWPIEQGLLRVGDVLTLGAVDLQVRFNLRRPTINRPLTVPLPALSARTGPPPKEIPKGPITYEKVSKSLRNSDKGKPLFGKLRLVCSAAARTPGSRTVFPMHILLIDDSSSTRSLLRTLINSGPDGAPRHQRGRQRGGSAPEGRARRDQPARGHHHGHQHGRHERLRAVPRVSPAPQQAPPRSCPTSSSSPPTRAWR